MKKRLLSLILVMFAITLPTKLWAQELTEISSNYVLVCDELAERPGKGNLFGDNHFLDVTGGTVATSKGAVDLSVPDTLGENGSSLYVTDYIVSRYGQFGKHLNYLRLKNAQDVISMKVKGHTRLIFFLQGNNKEGIEARIPKISKNADLSNPLNDPPTENHPTTISGYRYDFVVPEDMQIYVGSYNGDLFVSYIIAEVDYSEPEPYAVLSNDYKTLTFYYDDKKAANNGKDVGPFEYSGDRGWYALQNEIKTVKFDSSFAGCTTLTSTALWFCNCKNLTSISGLEYLKTDNVTDMNRMFMGCGSLTAIDAAHFNTANVTRMDYMFYECTNLASLDVSGFKTAKVESMECMFRGCSSLASLNVSNFNTENVEHMSYMFSNCASLAGIDVSGFNTAKSFDTDHMFNGCSNLTSLDLSSFNTAKMTHMASMFKGCSGLTTIYAGDGWSTASVTSGEDMFTGCTSLVGGAGTAYDSLYVDYTYAHFDGGPSNPGYFTAKNASASTLEIYSIEKGVTYTANQGIKPTQSIIMTPGNDSEWRTDLAIGITNTATGESDDPLQFTASIYYPNSTETFSFLDALRGTLNPKDGDLTTNPDTGEVTNTGSAYSPEQKNLPKSGAYIIYEASQNGSLIIPIRVTADKSLFVVTADGSLVLDMQFKDAVGTTQVFKVDPLCSVSSEYISGFISLNVEAGQKYYVFCNASKPRIAGYVFSPESITIDPATMADVIESLRLLNREPYAVLSEDNTVLTFYYDDQKTARNGMSVGPFEYEYNDSTTANKVIGKEWDHTITTVVFDDSFSNCNTLTSTALWFCNCNQLTSIVGIENLKTDNVTVMNSMFEGCSSLTNLDVSRFNTANVTSMWGMFRDCSKLTSLDVSHFNTAKVKYMTRMFENCAQLSSLNVSGFKTDSLTAMGGMFLGCSNLTSLDVSNFNTENVEFMWSVFEGCSSLTTLDVSNFKTSNVIIMGYMFSGCSNLTNLDVSGFNTANVTGMWNMFSDCSGLTNLDVSGFKTDNVTDMTGMFWNCSALTSLNVSNFNTENVEYMWSMFSDCSSLTNLDVSGFKTDNVTDMTGMFWNCSALTSLNVSNFNTENVKYMGSMFQDCSSLTSLDVSKFKTDNVSEMHHMFDGCSSLTTLDVSTFKTDNVTDMSWMFYECSTLTALDVSKFNTDNVTNMRSMFCGCSALTTLDVSNFKTDNVTDMYCMFYACPALTSINVSNFKTDDVTNMSGMFYNCSGLTTLDVSNFKTDKVTEMKRMFYNCSSLTTLDVSSFNTDNVTDMIGMFEGCSTLTSLDVSRFNTNKVKFMTRMFLNCSQLSSLDVRNFKTDSLTSMGGMFGMCSSLTILDVSGFNTENVEFMWSVFEGCSSLTTLDVSNFKTDNVIDVSWMFSGCSKLTTLDLSSFNTSKVFYNQNEYNYGIESMFSGCSGLTTITVGEAWNTANLTESSDVFKDCINLVGGKGTTYDSLHIDYTYAHVDGGPDYPGYFTRSGDEPYMPVNYTLDSNGVLTVGGSTTLADALSAAGGRDEVAKAITAIVWNSIAPLTNDSLQGLDNPNMLIYVQSESRAPANRNNVVIGNDSTGYTAKNIKLTDVVEGNGNFYCPREFKAEMISYTHEYHQQTEVGVSRGWETIALPFTVQTIMHETNGAIAPFGNSNSSKHFWLRQLTHQGLAQATQIEANTPYLISMPNNAGYFAEFNQAGRVTFSSQNVEVPVTQLNGMEAQTSTGDMVMIQPNFKGQSATAIIYALNVGVERDGHPEGSVFEANYRTVRPFEAFTVHHGNGPAPRFVPIMDIGGTTGIETIGHSPLAIEQWYTIDGRKLQQKPTRKGVYLNNGSKVIIR